MAWHRRLGLASLALLILLVLTGLALNHNNALGLDERPVSAPLVLSWYGLAKAGDPVSFEAAGRRLTWYAGAIFLDDRIVDESPSPLVGAVGFDGGIVFATAEGIAFIDAGEIVSRRLDADALPGAVQAVARAQSGNLVIRTNGGAYASADLASWRPISQAVAWRRATPLPTGPKRRVMETFSGQSLPLGRILLDLHSGRIFGSWGPYLMDAAALCLLFLSVSGFYNWYAARRK